MTYKRNGSVFKLQPPAPSEVSCELCVKHKAISRTEPDSVSGQGQRALIGNPGKP
jgi:hypothetical protein